MRKTIILLLLLFAAPVMATVSDGESIRQYFTCNGSTTIFTFTQPVNSADDILVWKHLLETGVETALAVDTDYTIAATGGDYLNGGVVTIDPALAATFRVVIVREIKKSQETTTGAMSAAAAVIAFDKLTRVVQDLEDRNDRSIHLQESDAASFDMEIPGLALRAETYPYFDVNGTLTYVVGVTPDDVVVSAYGETLIDDANPLAARATLGLTDGTADVNLASIETRTSFDVGAYADFSTALSTIGSTVGELHIYESMSVAGDETVPATLSLVFHTGGILVPATNKTITINGPQLGGVSQRYDLSASGSLVEIENGLTARVVPEWWGAVESASNTANTAGIQAAIDAMSSAGGGEVSLLGRRYQVNAMITLKSNVNLIGAGSGVTFLDFDSSASAVIMLSGGTAVLVRCKIANLDIDGNDKATVGVSITFTGGSDNAHLRLIDVNIHNMTSHGVHWEKFRNSTIEKSVIHNNGGHGIFFDTSTASFTSTSIEDVWIHTISLDGVNVSGAQAFNSLTFRNIYCEVITGNGILFNADSSEFSIYGGTIEAITQDGIRFDVAAHGVISGVLFSDITGKGIHSVLGAPALTISGNRFASITGNDIDYGAAEVTIIGNEPDNLDIAGSTPPRFYDYNARTVEAHTSDYTILFPDHGKTLTNEGTSGDVTFTLPTIAANDVGMIVQIIAVTSGNDIFIDPAAAASIRPTVTSNGFRLKNTGSTTGDSVKLQAIATTVWSIIAEKGTWTNAGS